MFDFPTILCCLNYANIYCLEVTCLITSISIFALCLVELININWNFMQYLIQILYSINLAISVFTIFMIIFIFLSTTSKRILLNNYYKAFGQIACMLSYIFLFLLFSFSLCAYFILGDFMKIKKGKYNYKGYNKFEIKRIKDFVDSKKNWILLYITNLIPILFSLLNIFLWLSIYYRISFRIYCSFNYEIRKELRKMKKKEMTTLEEETTNDNNDKIKNNKVEKVEMSVVFEKDRHPSYSKNVMNVKNFGDLKLNKLTTKFQEEFQTGFSSSKRDIKPSFGNNNI